VSHKLKVAQKTKIIIGLIILTLVLSIINLSFFVHKNPGHAYNDIIYHYEGDYKYILFVNYPYTDTTRDVEVYFGNFYIKGGVQEPVCTPGHVGFPVTIKVSGSGNTLTPSNGIIETDCYEGFAKVILSSTVAETKVITTDLTDNWPDFKVEVIFKEPKTVQQIPTVSLAAAPTTINKGQPTTLTWETANANSVRIEPDVGEITTAGSIEVKPALTTTYTLTATNGTGSATTRVTINVNADLNKLITPSPNIKPTPPAPPSDISPEKSEIRSPSLSALANGRQSILFSVVVKDINGNIVTSKQPMIVYDDPNIVLSGPNLDGDIWKFSLKSDQPTTKDVIVKVDQTILGTFKVTFSAPVEIPPTVKENYWLVYLLIVLPFIILVSALF
jgi:hypothetical protein